MSREYPLRPIVGVGAIIFSEGEVLMARRGKAPGVGNWSVPGGALELGETLEEACKREVLEETGLAVEIVSRCAVLDRITRDNWDRVQYHYVLVDFACRPLEGSLQPGSDITEARWVPLEELENIEPMTRGTARVILDAAGDLQAQNISF
ncbi:MAG: NUDIX hydrolase [Nitrospinota bacterium]|jgi:ADP-ribose pyrophosphatase YjhB (NUDIX family)|nr:NUDIX hydrolase [Nitrospinota bacterium]MDP7370772.1 NUDIX hydrolase [Nitrospinota bacterium]MDP7502941.1 NUDIX hydrolase [Nitrospinota bacterium]MDP7664558.1 NUDIX hydrolase [Nitrospinota bacterium]HJP13309.1 NUDIX hydrolase [Nitrospinota bacterium]